ncbi:MAG: alpha/beta hydrolase [Oscillospiraceae bacterium]|nr:alpha/beta hydrolase [Oscillospiraceae bacterium]
MMKILKRVGKIMLIIIAFLAAALLVCYINHRVRLAEEAERFTAIGTLVNVNGHNMNVYTEGEGDVTVVFMSGGGTCSPVLDFRSLYSRLTEDHAIAVVEKIGYGFSDVADIDRDIDSILSDTRAALAEAGVNAPYILCPHSMSGLEAIYWAQKYPEEVLGIVGLDMSVPGYYDDMKINIPLLRLATFGAGAGITRFIPGLSESDAIKYGTLTEEEKEIYRAVFYRRTATVTMINESEAVKANAEKTAAGDFVQLPVLMFISDGSGTGFEKDEWRRIAEEYISHIPGGRYIELDCPHYVHNYEYERIADEMKEFIELCEG